MILRSRKNSEEDVELDQDAEDTNTYDLSQVEVIDVDAPSPMKGINKERDLKNCLEKIWRRITNFCRYSRFFLYIAGELEEDISKASVPSTGTQSQQYVDHFGPFTIVSMYYMRAMAYSQLFQALTEQNLPKAATGCQFNGRTLTYKVHFEFAISLNLQIKEKILTEWWVLKNQDNQFYQGQL